MEIARVKVLIFGSSGFIGRSLVENISNGHDVYTTTRLKPRTSREHSVDLLEKDSIEKVISTVCPDIIINAAGIVDPSDDTMQNITFTRNLLNAITNTGCLPRRVIIFGSAGEYGNVNPDEIPVSEHVPLRASTGYGYAKRLEEEYALSRGRESGIPVLVVRVFNPLGKGMADKFLVSRLKKQIKEYSKGVRSSLDVSRNDSERDYIAVDDISSAVRCLVDGSPAHQVYNIGSGVAMSNVTLLQLMLKGSTIGEDPRVIETADQPELPVASQADIKRIQQEFGWAPQHNIADIVEEIMND